MKTLSVALLFVPVMVLADVGFRQANTYMGPIRDLDCAADAGLLCTRDAGYAIGKVRCAAASTVEPGCITPNAQTLAGTKTLTGDLRLVGHVHASLTACSSGVKGMFQTCTSHNALVFCDGTSNIEIAGSAATETMFEVHMNRMIAEDPAHDQTTGLLDYIKPAKAFTAQYLYGLINYGTGTTVDVLLYGASGTCTFQLPCAASACGFGMSCGAGPVGFVKTTASGSCSYAAGELIAILVYNNLCTAPPTVLGTLRFEGYLQ